MLVEVIIAEADKPDCNGTVRTKESLEAMCMDRGSWPDNVEHMWMNGKKLMARMRFIGVKL